MQQNTSSRRTPATAAEVNDGAFAERNVAVDVAEFEATCLEGPLGISMKKLVFAPGEQDALSRDHSQTNRWAAVLIRKTKPILQVDLLPGDRLVKVNGKGVDEMEDYKDLLSTVRSTRPITLTFARSSRTANPNTSSIPSRATNSAATKSATASTHSSHMRSTSPQRTRDRLGRLTGVLNGDVVDMDRLRELGFDGIPAENGTRALAWRLLLGLLPPERAEWEQNLTDKRKLYEDYRQEMCGASTTDGSTPTSRPRRLQGQAWFEHELISNTKPFGTNTSVEAEDNDDNDTASATTCSTFAALNVLDTATRSTVDQETLTVAEERKEATHDDKGGRSIHSGSAEARELRREACAEVDNPLSTAQESAWQTQFADKELREEIWKDVQRTHPGLHFFTSQTYNAMERILFVFAKLNPGVRYVQGMNEVLAPIMYVFGSDTSAMSKTGLFASDVNYEADSFFCFTNLMGEIRDLFVKDLDSSRTGVRGRIEDIMQLLQTHDEPVYATLESQDLDAQYFALRWVTTLLSRELDLPDTVRVWDALFSDSHRFKLLPAICCAMIIQQRQRLLIGDFSSNLKLLQRYPPTDVLALLSDARAIRANVHTRYIRTSSPTAGVYVSRADAAMRLAKAQAKLKQTGSRASSAAAAASRQAMEKSKAWSRQAEAGWSALMANTTSRTPSIAIMKEPSASVKTSKSVKNSPTTAGFSGIAKVE